MTRAFLVILLAISGSIGVACTGGGDGSSSSGETGSSGVSSSSGSTGSSGSSSEKPTISLDGYDRSCVADDDCMAVYEGSVCGCGCANTAIAKKERAKLDAEIASLKKSCPSNEACAADCVLAEVHCNAGTCAFGPGPKDAAAD